MVGSGEGLGTGNNVGCGVLGVGSAVTVKIFEGTEVGVGLGCRLGNGSGTLVGDWVGAGCGNDVGTEEGAGVGDWVGAGS